MSYQDVYSAFRLAGFIHNEKSLINHNSDSYIQDFKAMYPVTSEIEYIAEYKDGLTYLKPVYNKLSPTLGPYLKKEDAEGDADQLRIELTHYPEDILFDIAMCEEEEDIVVIYLGSQIQLGHDNLGGHNVFGLPPYFSSCDMENTWSIEGKTLQEVKDDMIACRFLYDNFLDSH